MRRKPSVLLLLQYSPVVFRLIMLSLSALTNAADIYDTDDPTDTWWHIMDNVQHNARGTQRFQSCGKFNMPDMLTIGQVCFSFPATRRLLCAVSRVTYDLISTTIQSYRVCSRWVSAGRTKHRRVQKPDGSLDGHGLPAHQRRGHSHVRNADRPSIFLLTADFICKDRPGVECNGGIKLLMDGRLDAAHLKILTNKALLEVNRDPLCVMGSMSRSLSGFQTWVKPLSRPHGTAGGHGKSKTKTKKSFFLVLLNTNDATAVDIPVVFNDYYRGDFEPTDFSAARIYDLWHDPPQLLGEFKGNFTARGVAPHASMALRMDVVDDDSIVDSTAATLGRTASSSSEAGDCSDVRTFGARGDSATNDTAAIQSAIDTCASRKQTLVIRAAATADEAAAADNAGGKGGSSIYCIAALELRSNLHMTLEAGVTLRADNDTDRWPKKHQDGTAGSIDSDDSASATLAPCRNIIAGSGDNRNYRWSFIEKTSKRCGLRRLPGLL